MDNGGTIDPVIEFDTRSPSVPVAPAPAVSPAPAPTVTDPPIMIPSVPVLIPPERLAANDTDAVPPSEPWRFSIVLLDGPITPRLALRPKPVAPVTAATMHAFKGSPPLVQVVTGRLFVVTPVAPTTAEVIPFVFAETVALMNGETLGMEVGVLVSPLVLIVMLVVFGRADVNPKLVLRLRLEVVDCPGDTELLPVRKPKSMLELGIETEPEMLVLGMVRLSDDGTERVRLVDGRESEIDELFVGKDNATLVDGTVSDSEDRLLILMSVFSEVLGMEMLREVVGMMMNVAVLIVTDSDGIERDVLGSVTEMTVLMLVVGGDRDRDVHEVRIPVSRLLEGEDSENDDGILIDSDEIDSDVLGSVILVAVLMLVVGRDSDNDGDVVSSPVSTLIVGEIETENGTVIEILVSRLVDGRDSEDIERDVEGMLGEKLVSTLVVGSDSEVDGIVTERSVRRLVEDMLRERLVSRLSVGTDIDIDVEGILSEVPVARLVEGSKGDSVVGGRLGERPVSTLVEGRVTDGTLIDGAVLRLVDGIESDKLGELERSRLILVLGTEIDNEGTPVDRFVLRLVDGIESDEGLIVTSVLRPVVEIWPVSDDNRLDNIPVSMLVDGTDSDIDVDGMLSVRFVDGSAGDWSDGVDSDKLEIESVRESVFRLESEVVSDPSEIELKLGTRVGRLRLNIVLTPSIDASRFPRKTTSVATPGFGVPDPPPRLLTNVQVPLAYVAPAQPGTSEHCVMQSTRFWPLPVLVMLVADGKIVSHSS